MTACVGVAPGASFTTIMSNPGGEPDLLATLDSIYGPGGYVRLTDDGDRLWNITEIGFSATAASSFATGVLNFGLCQLCDGSDDIVFTPSIIDDGAPLSIPLSPDSTVADGVYNLFSDSLITVPGFENDVGRVFSNPASNAGDTDHMVTFGVVGSPNVYIIAFEDILSTGDIVSDRDFNDLVLEVTSLHPVPEPGSLTLLAGGLLLGLGLYRRRSKSL